MAPEPPSRALAAAIRKTQASAYAKPPATAKPLTAAMLATEVSPRSLREMKREIWNAQFQGLGEAIEAANLDMTGSFASADFKEGVAHYRQKRPAAFTGR